MLIEKLFNFISKYHHNKIAYYCKKLEFNTLIDIGAHKGEFLSSFLNQNKIKRIYCFEPQQKIFIILKKKFSKIKKIKLFNFALGNFTGKKKIYESNLSSAATLSTFNKNSYYLKLKNLLLKNYKNSINEINQKTFDNVFLKHDLKKTFLKIDVEGYEYQVLKGSKKRIKEIDYILIEQQFFNQYNNSFKNVKNFLIRNNFQIVKNFYFPTLHYKDILFVNKKKGSKNCPF